MPESANMEQLLALNDYIQNEIDDIENQIFELQTQKKAYVVRKRLNAFEEYSDEDFQKRFRLSKAAVNYLHSLIKNDLEPETTRIGFTLSAMDKILITLRYYATASFHRVSSDCFGVSESIVCRIVPMVSDKIAALREQFIRMPFTDEELVEKKKNSSK